MKVVLITNIATPYRIPLWNTIASKVEELHVVTLAKNEKNRKWVTEANNKFTLHCINSRGIFIAALDGALYWGGNITRRLESIKPTHIIFDGYAQLPYVVAINWAWKNRIPSVQWYRSHPLSSRFRNGPVAYLKKQLLKTADAWAVPGQLTKSYLLELGIPANRISISSNSVDVEVYAKVSDTSLPGGLRVLYVGQLIKRKGVDLLIQAFLAMDDPDATLRIVGNGTEEDQLRALTRGNPSVDFVGHTTSPEMTAKHYAWADIMVMPSLKEVWGLVANEALASGCYLISSSTAGATPDLIDLAPFEVGASVDVQLGMEPLKLALQRAVMKTAWIRENRANIKKWGAKFSIEASADGLIEALLLAECGKAAAK